MVDRFQMKTEHDWICARLDEKGDWVRHSDYAALEAQLAERVNVKPLEWHDGKVSDRFPRLVAETQLGTYEALQWSSGEFGGSVPSMNRADNNREFSGLHSLEAAKSAAQADYDRRILSALEATPPAPKVTDAKPARRTINDEQEVLTRLAAGDKIAFSEDGETAWFTEGDRAFVGSVITDMRSKGYLNRITLDDENYRGASDRDVISETGRQALTAAQEAGR